MTPPVFVLTLARMPERIDALGAALDRLQMTSRHHAARDRLTEPSERLISEFGQPRIPVTAGDMACTLGHVGIWRRVAEGSADVALVLEDDAWIADSLPEWSALAAGVMRRRSIGVTKLEAWSGPQQSRRVVAGKFLREGPREDSGLYALRSSFLGSAGYLISKDAARGLILSHPRSGLPVDHLLFSMRSPAHAMLRPAFVNPAPVRQDLGRFPSDIAAERRVNRRRVSERLSRGKSHLLVKSGQAEWVEVRAETMAELAEG